MLSIGLMSGTSMDGIDAALIELNHQEQIQELGHHSISYDPCFKILLKAAELAVRKNQGEMQDAEEYYLQAINDYLTEEFSMHEQAVQNKLLELGTYLNSPITLHQVIQHSTHLHQRAVEELLHKTGFSAQQIDVIGYHGQTLFHKPSIKKSIIVGDGKALANQLGITVVNDFRSRDIRAGGQGAPFAPLYHQLLAQRDKKLPLAVVNCGGIANISLIKNANPEDLIGFDTGPGNGLIDRFVRQRTRGEESMDKNGQYGQKGNVDEIVLNALYKKAVMQNGVNYFDLPPPKSLDIGDLILIPELDELSLEDGCATLEAFTADTIVSSLTSLNLELPQNWILAGGGWNNPVIYHQLLERLKSLSGNTVSVLKAEEAGWNSQAMEAQIFAYLAVRSLQNKPLSVPGTTKVHKALSGGHAYIPECGPTKPVEELVKLNQAVLYGYEE